MEALIVVLVVVTLSCLGMVSTSGCHYHEDCSSHEDCICACCNAGYCNLGKCICDPFKRKRALSEPFSRDIYTGERRAQFEDLEPEQDKDANCKKAYRFIQQHCDTKQKIPRS